MDDKKLLWLFREFVLKNVTQWKMGAGDHHHPMWGMVAESLEHQDECVTGLTGPHYRFVQPDNRKSLDELNGAKTA